MSAVGVRVREARHKDIHAVVALERAVEEAPHWAEDEYAGMLDGMGVRRRLVVAERDGRLLGFAVGKVVGIEGGAVGELESVAVAHDARRGGVGKALCEAVLDWCGEQSAGVVELEVRSGSEGAIALYRSLGFVSVGLRKRYYRDPVDDAVLMNRVIRIDENAR